MQSQASVFNNLSETQGLFLPCFIISVNNDTESMLRGFFTMPDYQEFIDG